LKDQIKVFVDGFVETTIYQEYSDESDQAWEDLYNRVFSLLIFTALILIFCILGTIFAMLKNEAALLPNRTWPISDMPGYYIGQLEVFHQLHCLVYFI
jgi:hypothetical protein